MMNQATERLASLVRGCANISLAQTYAGFQKAVYDSPALKVGTSELGISCPLRTLAATVWEYLGGDLLNESHRSVLSVIGPEAIKLKDATLLRLGQVARVDGHQLNTKSLWELVKQVQKDHPDLTSKIREVSFAGFKKFVRTVLANYVSEDVRMANEEIVIVLLWKRLGGNVMNCSYSELHARMSKTNNIEAIRNAFLCYTQKEEVAKKVEAPKWPAPTPGLAELKEAILQGKPLPDDYEYSIGENGVIYIASKAVAKLTDNGETIVSYPSDRIFDGVSSLKAGPVYDSSKEGALIKAPVMYWRGLYPHIGEDKVGNKLYEPVKFKRQSNFVAMDYDALERRYWASMDTSKTWDEFFFGPRTGRVSGSTPQTCKIQQLPKEAIMKAYTTVNYVYDNDITTLSTEQLIAFIKKAEGERNALDGVKTPSKKIKAMQADLDAAIAKMVEALDATVPAAT